MTNLIKTTATDIYNKLKNEYKITEKTGRVTITLGDITLNYTANDAIGNLLQEWLKKWLTVNNYYFRCRSNSQEFPDFYLEENNGGGYLEVKAFNNNASPAFDIANFNSYNNSILNNPEKIDADYLIFSYSITNDELKIENIWLKKVWEITGEAKNDPLTLQIKNNQVYNIRPKKWFSKNSNKTPKVFKNKSEFIQALSKVIIKYPTEGTKKYAENWLENIKQEYKKKTGKTLEE